MITHSGTEMGQGINTKAAQTCSYALGQILGVGGQIPLNLIRFDDLKSEIIPNASFTGGSTGSEATCDCVRRCCETLIARFKPHVDKLRESNEEKAKKNEKQQELTWPVIANAMKDRAVNMSAQADWSTATKDTKLTYQNYGCAISEVELDILTGDVKLMATDLVYDAGKSLNPAIDIGQCEGAFMMGVGFYLREEVAYEKHSGKLIGDNTWNYKPPLAADVPRQFNVSLLQDAGFAAGIFQSKCSGEPPLVLATSVIMAVRHALTSARTDVGQTEFTQLHVPATIDVIQSACAVSADVLSLAPKMAKKE